MMCGHGAAGQTVFPKKIRPHPNPLSLCEQPHLERSFCSYHYIKDLELWSFRIWGGPYIQGADVLLREKQREIGWAERKALQKPPGGPDGSPAATKQAHSGSRDAGKSRHQIHQSRMWPCLDCTLLASRGGKRMNSCCLNPRICGTLLLQP